jgi:hypothetical protein
MAKTALVVTSIAPPQKILRALAEGSIQSQWDFIVVGDVPSPEDFSLEGCKFLSLKSQEKLGFAFAKSCPLRHYSRKNIGYLEAIRDGAEIIVETDDDNMPREDFWLPRQRHHSSRLLEARGWINAYSYFSSANVWPRGFPLEYLQNYEAGLERDEEAASLLCPIQQGLADENPDVDAVFRLTMPLPLNFEKGKLALGRGAWCPFNSQNTTFYSEAFPLLYLPSYCSFRMTDIWRSFVAQRIAWENNWKLLFHEATVYQERNAHNLLKDFQDEIPGYLNNAKIAESLGALSLQPGTAAIPENLQVCYEALIKLAVIDARELTLLGDWLQDLRELEKEALPAKSQEESQEQHP